MHPHTMPVEGTFSEGTRSYGLGRIRAHRQTTSETVIGLQLLVMNLFALFAMAVI
jgi:IS5 family transposase